MELIHVLYLPHVYNMCTIFVLYVVIAVYKWKPYLYFAVQCSVGQGGGFSKQYHTCHIVYYQKYTIKSIVYYRYHTYTTILLCSVRGGGVLSKQPKSKLRGKPTAGDDGVQTYQTYLCISQNEKLCKDYESTSIP